MGGGKPAGRREKRRGEVCEPSDVGATADTFFSTSRPPDRLVCGARCVEDERVARAPVQAWALFAVGRSWIARGLGRVIIHLQA